jgi:LacI family transcriptional regulator
MPSSVPDRTHGDQPEQTVERTFSDSDGSADRLPRPTMRDVAALANVSLSTVSRVVNGLGNVDPKLSDRVHRAVIRLGYQQNLPASTLRRSNGKTATVGLLLEDVGNPFSATLHRAVEDAAAERGFLVLAVSLDEKPKRERELVMALIARRVDGFIIVPAGSDQSYLVSERQAGTAFVFADRPPRHMAADSVVSDNRAGAAGAMARLIALGHRRIGYLGDLRSIPTAHERFAGYLDALKDAGIAVDESIVVHDLHTAESTEEAALGMLRRSDPPTALFTGQNLVTIGGVRALHQLGLEHRVAQVGFDDLVLAELIRPGLSVVAQDSGDIGRRAAECLFRRLDGDTGPHRDVVVPTRFVARGSGEIPPPNY